MPRFCPILCLFLGLLGPPAWAQSFNLDVAEGAGTPNPNYGGAARQPGAWNSHPGNDMTPFALKDLSGNTSNVTLWMPLPFGPAHADHPATGGDEAALLDDYFDLHSTPAAFELVGLRPGRYGVYTYAWAPDDAAFRTTVEVNGQGAVLIGGGWPGSLAEGFVYAHHQVTITGTQSLSIFTFGRPRGTLNGLQIVEGEELLPTDAGVLEAGADDAEAADASTLDGGPDSGADLGPSIDAAAPSDSGPKDRGAGPDLGAAESPTDGGATGPEPDESCACQAHSTGPMDLAWLGLLLLLAPWRRRWT